VLDSVFGGPDDRAGCPLPGPMIIDIVKSSGSGVAHLLDQINGHTRAIGSMAFISIILKMP